MSDCDGCKYGIPLRNGRHVEQTGIAGAEEYLSVCNAPPAYLDRLRAHDAALCINDEGWRAIDALLREIDSASRRFLTMQRVLEDAAHRLEAEFAALDAAEAAEQEPHV